MPEDIDSGEALAKATQEAETAKADAVKAKAETEQIKVEKEKVDNELKGLRSKEYNFKKLRDMTEAEKEKLTDKELELQKRQEALEDQQAQHSKAIKDDWRNSAIDRYSRGDKDKAEKIREALKDLAGEETDRLSIETRVSKAARLIKEDKEIDHVGTAFNSMSGEPPEKPEEKDFADTEEGQAKARSMGFRFASKK